MRQVGERSEAPNGWCVRTAIVVDDDHEFLGSGHRDVVERLVRHPTGESAVTYDGNGPILGVGQCVPEGIGERSRGVAVLDEVVGAFLPARIAGHASVTAKGVEATAASGEELVDVRLMTDIPENPVERAFEGSMEGDCQLDHTEIWS